MTGIRHYDMFWRLCRSIGWRLETRLVLDGSKYVGQAAVSVMVSRSRPELGWSAIDVFERGRMGSVDGLMRCETFTGYPPENEFAAFVDSACSNWLHNLYGNTWRPFKRVVGGVAGGLFPYRSESEMRLALEAKGY